MRKIFDHFEKSLIADLPRVLFAGKIEVVISESEAKKAVSYLLRQPLLGFDTETRPCFKRGRQNTVALLQVSTDDICFLFRLNRIGMPPCLLRLLTDKKQTKIGLSWHDDLRALNQRMQFQAGTFVDLQDIATGMGIKDISLQKLYANILGGRITKGQQLSNWEADNLSDAQKLYAATDAWACIQIFREMTRLKEEGFTLEVTEPPVAPEPEEPEPKPEQTQEKRNRKRK